MWIEEHWGPLAAIIGAIGSAFAWFLRLELRLLGLDTRVKANTVNATKALDRLEEVNRIAADQMAALHEKVNLVAVTVSRIEGYCSGKQRDCNAGPAKE